MKHLSIYFHTPYCRSRCHFCAFYVVPGKSVEVDRYFDAMKQEVLSHKEKLKDYEIKTVYAGGGTPSKVESEYITDFISFLRSNLNISKDCEFSIESSPETLSEEKLLAYKAAGFSRLSIGLQSTHDRILKFLGRAHTYSDFLQQYNLAKKIGFRSINIDLIFGIPGLTMTEWQESLQSIIQLNPEHIACYSLIVDHDSTWGKLYRRGKFIPASDLIDRKMFKTAKRILKFSGYNQYEIANFSKAGFESQHNSSMWRDGDYLGLGASAYSRLENKHFANVSHVLKYIDKINTDGSAVDYLENISEQDQITNHILLRLRLAKEGINLATFKDKFGTSILELYPEEIEKLQEDKLIRVLKDRIILTSKGQDLENYVGGNFVAE